MATAANLTLKDKTDVNVTYAPLVVKTGEYAKYVDRTNTQESLQSTVAFSNGDSKKNTRRVTKGTLVFPAVTNATTGLIENAYGKFEFDLPLSFTDNQRKELTHRLSSACADAVVRTIAETGEWPW